MKKRFLTLFVILTLAFSSFVVFTGCGNQDVTIWFYNSTGMQNITATVIDPTTGVVVSETVATRDGNTNFYSVVVRRNPKNAPFSIRFGGSQNVLIDNSDYVFVTVSGERFSSREDARQGANRVVDLHVVFDRDSAVIGMTFSRLREFFTVTATYLDGTSRIIGSDEFTLTGLPATRVGESVFSIRYQNRVVTHTLDIVPRIATNLVVTINESISATTATILNSLKDDISVAVYFNDDTVEPLGGHRYSLVGELITGQSEIRVEYFELYAYFDVNVTEGGAPAALEGIEVEFEQGSTQILANIFGRQVVRDTARVFAIHGDQRVLLGVNDFNLEVNGIIENPEVSSRMGGEQIATFTYREETYNITVNLTHVARMFLFNARGWEGTIFAHVWYYTTFPAFNNPFGSWPGRAFTAVGGGWYYLDLPVNLTITNANMIVHSGGIEMGITVHSNDHVFATNANASVHTSRASAEEVEVLVVVPGETTIWFYNSANFARPMLHVWDTAGMNVMGAFNSATQRMTQYGDTNWWFIVVPRLIEYNPFYAFAYDAVDEYGLRFNTFFDTNETFMIDLGYSYISRFATREQAEQERANRQ
ncbi:MAG: starch-binding protein [Firmicutes bacterium]|nr:starch-binding protein [Bacillota bacterium]MCL2256278.1 starch-binding protein [Bacillota bacterium]